MTCLKIVFENKIVIVSNPYKNSEFVHVPYVNKLMYINYTFTSLLFCPKTKVLLKRSSWNNSIKSACFDIVFVDRIKIIDKDYIKLTLLQAQYVANLRYAKQTFTSLLLSPKPILLSKVSWKKGAKMTYSVITLADISPHVNTPYTKLASLDTNYNASFKYITPCLLAYLIFITMAFV